MSTNEIQTEGSIMVDPLLDSIMVAELPKGFTASDDPQPKDELLKMIYSRLKDKPTNREIM